MQTSAVLIMATGFACAHAQHSVQPRPKGISRPLATLIPTAGSLSVRLVGTSTGAPLTGAAGDLWSLELGELSYTVAARQPNVAIRRLTHSFVVSTEFGVEVRNTAAAMPGVTSFATLLAVLQTTQAQYVVRIDGVALQSGTQPVAAHLRSGMVTTHRLEIEIPTTLTEKEARLAQVIQFSVVPE